MINNLIHFIFDSEHIDSIQTRLYGFYTTEAGMFTQVPPDSRDIADATGPWVLVRRSQAGIEITQDSTGCFGLFLFRKGELLGAFEQLQPSARLPQDQVRAQLQ